MKLFDIHAHIFPDAIAERVVNELGEKDGVPPTYNGTRAGLLAAMQKAGITAALNCPVATRVEQVASINNWAVKQNLWPVLSLGGVHPAQPDPAAVLRRLKVLGLPGIKLHPEYQEFYPDEERLDVIWRTCVDLGLLVVLHCGEDIGFPPPYHGLPARVATVVRRFPGLKLVAAHLGGWRLWDEVEQHLLGLPVCWDISFTNSFIPDARLVALVRRHGVERVLFGSDGPWRDLLLDADWFRSLPFTPAEQQAIGWGNAARLLALPPVA